MNTIRLGNVRDRSCERQALGVIAGCCLLYSRQEHVRVTDMLYLLFVCIALLIIYINMFHRNFLTIHINRY